MDADGYLASLRRDPQRLAEAAGGHLDPRVPSCPDWSVADLVRPISPVDERFEVFGDAAVLTRVNGDDD